MICSCVFRQNLILCENRAFLIILIWFLSFSRQNHQNHVEILQNIVSIICQKKTFFLALGLLSPCGASYELPKNLNFSSIYGSLIASCGFVNPYVVNALTIGHIMDFEQDCESDWSRDCQHVLHTNSLPKFGFEF